MKKERSDQFTRTSLEDLSKQKIVLDIGGGERFGKWMKQYEPLFVNCDYRTFDYDASTNADVVGDIHAIPLPDESVDGIICSSVLEHVKNPLKAASELKRVLRTGGKIFFYVPSMYPYHARKGHYPDYWRFFNDTIELVFEGYSSKTIHKRGGYFLALSFFVPMQHKMRGVLTPLAEFLDTAFETESKNTTAGYYVYAVK
ncbi:MAG: type 11 methyltransferase [Parcubacteria group bacterium]|nr:type 11 methyltransferase [Parcubacteria group bacterium]